MKVLFDTDVVLDVLLQRSPFFVDSAKALNLADSGRVQGFLCATAVTTVHYVTRKVIGDPATRGHLRTLLSFCDVAPVNRVILQAALASEMSDFEDAVVCESARQIQADALVTRNLGDFKRARLPVYSPDQLLQVLHPL